GGTIVGSNSLRIVSVGDITNTSGTIKGGNVALASRSGSIINQTTSTAQGTNKSSSTLIGKTSVIEATGSLVLSAKKDITNIGAVVSAGGDATLVAGRSISFDTIENKSGSATTTRSSNLFGSTTKRTTTSSVKQVGSELTTGGTLVAQAGKDITFAGTEVKVAGDAALLAGGNVGIVSRENSSVTTVKKSSSGIGVGGSVYGTQKSTQKSTSVRNDASTLDVGGDAVIVAGKDVTVRGSDVNVAGSGLISATNVNVIAGRDYDETRTRTVTTGIGKIVGSNQAGGNVDKASTGTRTATGTEFGSSAGKGAAQVAAGASAEGGANASGGVALMSRTVRTVDTTDSRNVASNLRFGGDAQIDATGTVMLKGSSLDAAGALGINANRLDVLAGQDVKTSRVQTDTTNLGLMTSTANQGSTSATAGMSAVGQGMPGGNADAGAGVASSTDNRVSLMEQSIVDTKTRDVTSVGSRITSGKGLTANVRDTITLVGSSLKSGGDMTLDAGNIVSKAAEDVHETSTTSMQFATGYYAGAGGGASAQANGSAGLGG
ncbi:MAG: hemagglutinin repeat-containing protein, partial [Herbiconiux sp.]|nr:hemagglutinin repeat-containing protein [Herbiconiux sp.]